MIITVTDYTLSGKTITLNNLDFSPDLGNLLYVFNKTQNELYYVPAEGFALASMSGDVITINSTFNDLADGDVLHIQIDNTGYTQAISAVSLPLPTLASTSTGQASLLTELKLKADLTETQPISVASLPLPSGAATSAKQLADGHNVAVSNMIPAVETGLATSAKQLADDHNVTVSNMIAEVETGLATSAKQLADGHNVAVSNMIPAVETGLATSDNQTDGSQRTRMCDSIVETRCAGVSDNRNLKTSSSVRLVGTAFDGTTLDPNFWDGTVVTGTGAIAVDGEADLSTGATANSTAKLTSVRKARFVPGSPMEFKTVCEFHTAATANNVRQVGPYDADNGYYFKLDGTTFKIGSRTDKSGSAVDTEVSSGSFNGDVSTYVMDTAAHNMSIEYSAKSAYFIIDGVLIHKISLDHDDRPTAFTLPITIENNNTNDLGSDIEFHIFGAVIYRIGELLTSPTSDYQSGTTAGKILKYGAGLVHGLGISGVANTSVITLYDNIAASGTVLWASGTMSNKTEPFSLTFNKGLPFFTGLTLVIATAASTLTTLYE